MPYSVGAHSERISALRDLRHSKGRREQGRFVFEGATQLDEARQSGVTIEELYVTEKALGTSPSVLQLETAGVTVYLVDDRVAAKISDLDTPTGIVAVAPLKLTPIEELLARPGLTLVLADLNDPGNAGTLLRSAEAFGAAGVVFGEMGVDPHHPKVVRGAMGALFRLRLCIAGPGAFQAAAKAAGTQVVGLSAGGDPIGEARFEEKSALIVGHERRGLGAWSAPCLRRFAIPMQGPTESLNAAVAGSIALYEAARHINR